MSKRYVESTQFTDPWFRKLSPEAKLFWHFLTLHCDHSGTWERDDDYCKYLTGLKKSPKTLLNELGDRIIELSENKVLLPKFILFQQGKTLSEAKPPHRGILKLLSKHGLEMDADGITKPILNLTLSKAKAKDNLTLTKPLVTSNSNSNSKGIVKEGSVRETNPEPPDEPTLPPELDHIGFLAAWDEWTSYRRERKLPPYKPAALKAQRTRLARWTNECGMPAVIDAIRSSIANNYQGLFSPRPESNSPKLNQRPIDLDYANALD